jgi:hypothetical protein
MFFSWDLIILQVVNKYVFVLDQLVNMVNADIVISYDVFHRNILPQYIPLFDHFQVEVEIYEILIPKDYITYSF